MDEKRTKYGRKGILQQIIATHDGFYSFYMFMSGISRTLIEETDLGLLERIQGSANLLVSFGGIQQGMGIPTFEFFNSISSINCDKIFFRDFNQAWYQKGVDLNIDSSEKIIIYLSNIILNNKYEKVCFIGNSMGGYASILFGSILNIENIIAFSPQSFIGKWLRLVHKDNRWSNQLKKVYSFPNKKTKFFDLKKILARNADCTSQIKIYYSENHSLDKKHAERLGKNRNVLLFPEREGGHSVVKRIRDRGELLKIISECF